MKRIQRSFSGGAISPFVYPLADLKKRVNGLAKSKNGIVQKFGTWENRPGTEYIDTLPTGLYRRLGEGNVPLQLSPFVDSRGRLFLVEVYPFAVRVRDMDGKEVFSQFHHPSFPHRRGDAQFAQQGNTLLITSRFTHPYSLVENNDSWTYEAFLSLIHI